MCHFSFSCCACCASKLVFQTYLNQLLKSQSFDRIFIEPSGLGHADRMADILDEEQYNNWLKLESIITVLDAHQFADIKYRNNEIYQRQLQSADGLISNKIKLATSEEIEQLGSYLYGTKRPFINNDQGVVDLKWIDSVNRIVDKGGLPSEQSYSNSKFYRASIPIKSDAILDLSKFVGAIKNRSYQRCKAIINTQQGIMIVNGVNDQVTSEPYKNPSFSCVIEIIDVAPINQEQVSILINEVSIGE